MALSVNSVFEVRTTGNDTNGGGFVTGASGTDYSQQDAKNTVGSDISTTDAVANGTTTVTSVLANFSVNIIGNIIYISGAWYQVTARASTTSITVDRTIGAAAGLTMNIGGAFASLGIISSIGIVSGTLIWVKSGSYTVTSGIAGVSGGCFSSSLGILSIQGYGSVRGDLGTAPVFTASGISTFVFITASGADTSCYNISFDGAGLTSSRAFVVRGVGFKLTASNCTNSAFIKSNSTVWVRCVATGCSTATPFLSGIFVECIAHDNTVTAFIIEPGDSCIRCIADSNTGASTDGFFAELATLTSNCIAYGNGRDGFRFNDDGIVIQNSIAEGNTGIGINVNANDAVLLNNNATYNNTGGGISGTTGKGIINLNPVTLTGSPFTNAANQDFSLNNTASAGASCRAAGYPGALPIGGTGYLDIGVLQHQDPAGGSGGGLRLVGHGGLVS